MLQPAELKVFLTCKHAGSCQHLSTTEENPLLTPSASEISPHFPRYINAKLQFHQ